MYAALLILDSFVAVTLISVSHIQRQSFHQTLDYLVLLLLIHGLFKLAHNCGRGLSVGDYLSHVILNLFLNQNSLAQRFVI
jgi:hypothetical protein